MVRTYKRKTSHGLYTSDDILRAVDQVIHGKRSLRSVSAETKIPFNTLRRYVQKKKQGKVMTVGFSKTRQVFTDKQEEVLEKFILTASEVYFGLTPKEIRILALQCAKKYSIETPQSWEDNGWAGSDWFTTFSKRHPNLSILVPEPISLARAASFNPIDVGKFFSDFADIIEGYKFPPAETPKVNSGDIESTPQKTVNPVPALNGVGGANDQVYISDSSNPAYIEPQDTGNRLNNLPTTDYNFLPQQQQQQHQQQQHSLQQSKHVLSLKSSPPNSPAQHPNQKPLPSMVFPNLPRGVYITQNAEEEMNETDRKRDNGVMSTDDCDIIESKESIASQIELMQSSGFTNSELAISSQTTVGDQMFSNINLSSLSNSESEQMATTSENKADIENDSIAEYFKICDNDTRQTFLDVMRNDREQHLMALDKINTELKTVKLQLQQTKTEHISKDQQLQKVMKQMNLLQMEVLNLHSRCTELSDREKNLQRKLKTYTKKVSLCDSALNAMTND